MKICWQKELEKLQTIEKKTVDKLETVRHDMRKLMEQVRRKEKEGKEKAATIIPLGAHANDRETV